MKFVKSYAKFTLNESKSINLIDEFQSCIDMIGSNNLFKFTSGNDWIKFTHTLYTEQFITVDEFEKQVNERKIVNELYDDIIHVCNRLKLDGYDFDIVSDSDSVKISIDLEDDISFIIADPEDDCININKSKLNKFLKSIGISFTKIKFDDRRKGIDKYLYSHLDISVDKKPTHKQFKSLVKKVNDIRPVDENGEELEFYDEFYFNEEDMEISIEFSPYWSIYFE